MTKKTKLAGIVAVCMSILASSYVIFGIESEHVDTRHNGAFQLADGSIVAITPSNSERIRIRHFNDGKVQSLYHDGTGSFNVANGFDSREFVGSGEFKYTPQGIISGASWKEDGANHSIKRIALRHEEIIFNSGDLRLRGKLTLPEGDGPFPVVIMVHGSEAYSAVDYYHLPYMLAAKGIAGFKFDKRGTGGSDGEYTQHFPTLAADVVAAVNQLKSRNDINSSQINLAGFSQGGWIAPLVAQQTDINSIMVAFGCAVSVKREDRWGYVKRLQETGFGTAEIALADEMNAALDAIVDKDDGQAWEILFELRDKYIDEAWFKAIAGSDSLLGKVVEKAIAPSAAFTPNFGWKIYFNWKRGDGPNFNRNYNPRVTLNEITTPSMWLLAGEDSSVPTFETTQILDELQQLNKPVEYKVYKTAEHGNVLFETTESGDKAYTHYVPDYFKDIVAWFDQQNKASHDSIESIESIESE